MTMAAGQREPSHGSALADPMAGRLLFAWLVSAVSPMWMLVLAAIPVAVAGWAVLSPPVVLSREMTWDLLFNLAGAWHLHLGQIAHVDFHDPVGELNFLLTDIGFDLVGVGPHAFLVGAVVMAAALFVAAASTAWRRLPALPAAIFIAFVCLLSLMPANVGDNPNAYSFAMSYNRYGWSCVSILFLILFQPPQPRRWGDTLDIVVAAALLAAMFYLKMTYFLMGIAALPVAALVSPHLRKARYGWMILAIAAVALAISPFNRAYWSDLVAAADAGQARDVLADHINNFLAHAGEYAPYLAGFAVALWMWRRGDAPLRLPVATGFILAAGAALLSQNAQTHNLPVAVVIAFLFYAVLRERRLKLLHGGSVGLLAALLVFPVLSIGASTASLTGYHLKAMQHTTATVESTNLRGLAVPKETPGLLAAFAGTQSDYHLLNRARAIAPRYELSPSEYVETLLNAVDFLRKAPGRHDRIVVLDQVNPFPFMLGLAPPRGGNLWSGPGAPVPDPEQLFSDADSVLIPKFSTFSPWTQQALATYRPYLDLHFPQKAESDSWILLSRPPRAETDTAPSPSSDLRSNANISTRAP